MECTPRESGACTGKQPACGADHTCRACAAHDECPSKACLPNGSCALETDVAYVDSTGSDNITCTPTAPCAWVSAGLATRRPYVKLTGTFNEPVTITRDVTILAEPGTVLMYGNNVLEIVGQIRVAIYDLEIGHAVSSGIGIKIPFVALGSPLPEVTLERVSVRSNQGIGLVAFSGLVMARRSVFIGNEGGGIWLYNTQFILENNVIARNGGLTTPMGGVRIEYVHTGWRRLEFNTITENTGHYQAVTGVACVDITQPLVFSSNIIWNNTFIPPITEQASGANCRFTYNTIGPNGFAGEGNIDADPKFVNPGINNFHLTAASFAIDRAFRGAGVKTDFDGEARPQGNGYDMGADEYVP